MAETIIFHLRDAGKRCTMDIVYNKMRKVKDTADKMFWKLLSESR